MVYRTPAFLIAFFISNLCFSQDSTSYYFVYLKDKPVSEYSLERPLEFLSQKALDRRVLRKSVISTSDMPVSPEYVRQVSEISGLSIINRSKWLNAVEIKTNGKAKVIEELNKLDCVSKVLFLGRIKNRTKPAKDPVDEEYYAKAKKLEKEKKESAMRKTREEDYGQSLVQNQQIGITGLHQYSLGNHMHIAVFDAGFFEAYKVEGMEDLLLPGVIIKDFVDYDNSVWEDDRHGMQVLGFMKAWNPGSYIGSAPMADYTLIRTENATSEYPVEEVNWLFAAEFADSLGVDMIVSSLGYHTFDDVSLNHTYAQFDGKTSIAAIAANFAYEKGIMIVTSAGNEGNSKWHRIGTPSDAPGVIGIGANDEAGFQVKFSSVGPSADHRVKPDFLALGYRATVSSPNGTYKGNGTSYSTPIFGGAMACLIDACPGKSFDEIKRALILSATHGNNPDSFYGYGLPDFNLALQILGYFSPSDTAKDLIYGQTNQFFFRDLGIHYRSKSAQTIKISVKGTRKKKSKNLFSETYTLKPGEWIHEDVLFKIYKKETRKKRKHKLKVLVLEIEAANGGSMKKTIPLIYE